MGFDSSGTFNRKYGSTGWNDDSLSPNKVIESVKHDDHDQDLANGLSNCITRDNKGGPGTDISWRGFRITNLISTENPGDAATVGYVQSFKGWDSSKYIGGADLNGRLNFTAPSGVNGITWTYANLSWVARHSKPGEGNDRLVLNNSVAPPTDSTAGDVVLLDRNGHISFSGYLVSNGIHDGSNWRTISPGYLTLLGMAGGAFNFHSNDVATITNAYAPAAARVFTSISNSSGNVSVIQTFNGSGKTANWNTYNNGSQRWLMRLGNGEAESANTGSNFDLHSYTDTGAYIGRAMHIDRATLRTTLALLSTGQVTVSGGLTATADITTSANMGFVGLYGGTANLTGGVSCSSVNATSSIYTAGPISNGGNIAAGSSVHAGNGVYYGSSSTIILSTGGAGGGNLYLRANNTSANQLRFDGNGTVYVCNEDPTAAGGILAGRGIRGKAGYQGAYDSNWINFRWTGSQLVGYADALNLGNIAFTCDYRIKKDIQPLGSMWDKVKALNPIRYTQRAYEIWTADNEERWGFAAHELQDGLGQAAATGVKDGPDIQHPNIMAIIAALTKALQEAMARIETLEAAP